MKNLDESSFQSTELYAAFQDFKETYSLNIKEHLENRPDIIAIVGIDQELMNNILDSFVPCVFGIYYTLANYLPENTADDTSVPNAIDQICSRIQIDTPYNSTIDGIYYDMESQMYFLPRSIINREKFLRISKISNASLDSDTYQFTPETFLLCNAIIESFKIVLLHKNSTVQSLPRELVQSNPKETTALNNDYPYRMFIKQLEPIIPGPILEAFLSNPRFRFFNSRLNYLKYTPNLKPILRDSNDLLIGLNLEF